MHCVCCDRVLSDFEATVRYKSTGDYADTCNECREAIGDDVEYITRTDIERDSEDEEGDYDDLSEEE